VVALVDELEVMIEMIVGVVDNEVLAEGSAAVDLVVKTAVSSYQVNFGTLVVEAVEVEETVSKTAYLVVVRMDKDDPQTVVVQLKVAEY